MQDSLVIVTPSHHVYIKKISALGVFDGKKIGLELQVSMLMLRPSITITLAT
jgi:hypothetical protein